MRSHRIDFKNIFLKFGHLPTYKPMKILHTADWHLGKRLDRFSRLEEQKEVMEEIIRIADEQDVDIVMIAGDLFDNFNPSVEATELFYKTVKRLSKDGKRPVIAIAGNHDSPNFIDAPDPLARACGIILIGSPNAVVQPFELDDFKITKSEAGFIELKLKTVDFPIRILHTPYANEVRLKQYFGEEKETALNQILKNQWRLLADKFCDEHGVNLLMTHLYMNKKNGMLLEESDGEKPLKIGNADLVFADAIPKEIQYTALGHLHGFHNVGSEDQPVVYSSAPLQYSFSEAGQKKFVIIVEANPAQKAHYQKVELRSGRNLIRQTFDSVDEGVSWLSENQNVFVEITLESDTFLKAEDRKRIYQSNDGIVYLIPKIKNLRQNSNEENHPDLSRDPLLLFSDYFKSKNSGQEPSKEILDLLKEVL